MLKPPLKKAPIPPKPGGSKLPPSSDFEDLFSAPPSGASSSKGPYSTASKVAKATSSSAQSLAPPRPTELIQASFPPSSNVSMGSSQAFTPKAAPQALPPATTPDLSDMLVDLPDGFSYT